VYSDTEIQCGQKNTVSSFPNKKSKEITRGDDNSNMSIRKRRRWGPSSSNWCSGRLWKTKDNQRRNLKGNNIVSAKTQLEKDSRDVLIWGQPGCRRTEKDSMGTETGLAIQTDWKSSQASGCGRAFGRRSALESGSNSGSPGRENGDQVHEQVQSRDGRANNFWAI
jgi:hypothetical protein